MRGWTGGRGYGGGGCGIGGGGCGTGGGGGGKRGERGREAGIEGAGSLGRLGREIDFFYRKFKENAVLGL